MKILLLISLLLVPLTVCAETYQWVDSRGSVSFTDDLGKVPKQYRRNVKVIREETGAPVVTQVDDAIRVVRPVEKKGEKRTLFGGKDERAWRSDFVQSKGELKAAEDDLRILQNRLQDTTKMSRAEYLNLQTTIKHEQYRVLDLRKKLDALTASADQAGVPMDFRQ